MFGGLPRRHGRRRGVSDALRRVFASTSEPLGVVLGAVDHLHRRAARRPPRVVSAPAKVAGMVLAGSVLSLLGVTMSSSASRSSASSSLSPDLAAARHRAVGGRAWPTPSTSSTASTGWPPASSRSRPARSSSTAQRLDHVGVLAAGNIGPLVADHRRSGCASASCRTTSTRPDLHGRLRRVAARPADGRVDDRRRRPRDDEPFSGQTFFFFAPLFIPLVHPRRADPRHRVRHRPPRHPSLRRSPRPTRTTSTTGSCASATASAAASLILWTWTALLSGFVLYPTFTGQGDAIVPIGMPRSAWCCSPSSIPGCARAAWTIA